MCLELVDQIVATTDEETKRLNDEISARKEKYPVLSKGRKVIHFL